MEESERPTEFLEEEIQHNALHSRRDWAAWVAVTTAILAAFAAVGSLLSNSRSNEAMMLQIQSTDQWSYYQEKGLKATLLASKIELLEVLNRPVPPSEKDKIRADLDKTGGGENGGRDQGTGGAPPFQKTRSILLGGDRISNRHLHFRHLAPHKTPKIMAPRACLRRRRSPPAPFRFSQVTPFSSIPSLWSQALGWWPFYAT